MTEASDQPAGSRAERQSHDECYACPIGSFFATMQATSPDTMDHVLNAASEILAVAKSAIEAAEAAVEQQRVARARAAEEPRVRRIDID